MSLQVWLPLIGNIVNQGLSEITAAVSGAAVNASGKLGTCYAFDGSDDYISLTGQCFYDAIKGGAQPFSIALWLYRADATRAVLFGDYSLSGAINFNLELTTAHQVRFYWGSSPDYKPSDTFVTATAWTHIAVIYSGSDLKFYINGVLTNTRSGALSVKTKTSGSYYLGRDSRTGTTVLNGRMNDFRLYDHALSAREVWNIAQGLVVHYMLNDQYVEPTTNLGGTSVNYTNQTYGTAYTASAWGGDAGTVTYYSSGGYAGGPYKVYHKTATGTGGIYRKTANNITIVSGHTYTMSVYVKASRNFTDSPYSFNINGVAGSDTNHYINYGQNVHFTTDWQRLTKTFTAAAADAGTYGEMSIVYEDSEADYYVYYSCFQIEEKDHATPFVIGARDQLTVYDSSGFGYRGTITGGNVSVASDAARYNASTQFPGTVYINAVSPTTEVRTIAFWAKWDAISSSNSVVYLDYKSKTGFGLASNGLLCSSTSLSTRTFSKASLVANTWYHFVVVCPNGGSDAARKLYINGVEQTATSSTNYWTSPGDRLNVGKRSSTANDGFKGKLSDFRMYTTALSAADILELYHTSAEIAKDGTYFTRELIE